MSRLILHRAYGSPAARSVQMLGELIGVPLEIKEVNLLKGENQKPEFKKLNPMGTVPVLQDGDFVLSESHAIMMYLTEKYGGDKREVLYPSEPRLRALVDQAMFFNAGFFFAALIAVSRDTFLGTLPAPTVQHIKRLESAYSVLEAYLADRKYVAADNLTLADLSNGSTAVAVQVIRELDPAKFPRSFEWLARLQKEHVFKTINAPGATFFWKLLSTNWEKNKLKNYTK